MDENDTDLDSQHDAGAASGTAVADATRQAREEEMALLRENVRKLTDLAERQQAPAPVAPSAPQIPQEPEWDEEAYEREGGAYRSRYNKQMSAFIRAQTQADIAPQLQTGLAAIEELTRRERARLPDTIPELETLVDQRLASMDPAYRARLDVQQNVRAMVYGSPEGIAAIRRRDREQWEQERRQRDITGVVTQGAAGPGAPAAAAAGAARRASYGDGEPTVAEFAANLGLSGSAKAHLTEEVARHGSLEAFARNASGGRYGWKTYAARRGWNPEA